MTSYKTPLVRQQGDTLITTSLAISHHFNRKHKDVLRAIKELDCSPEFNGRNFTPVSYHGRNGEKRPMYNITRDGFMFLCMGFTGREAALWKERYIKAFNLLEQRVLSQPQTLEVPAYVRQELLKARPLWQKIKRYKRMGLNHAEIAAIVKLTQSTVRRHVRKMEQCGVIEPPKNLQQLQQAAFDFLPHLKGGAL